MRCRLALFGLTFLASTFPALAQQTLPVPDPSATSELPPDRVGRVSYVSGSLAFHMPGETSWSAAGLNYPVSTGGSFWTDPKGRAEQRIGPNTLHIDGGTEIDLITLNDQVSQIGLPTGRVGVTLRQLGEGESFEIDVPLGGIWLLQSGHYDVSVGADEQPTRISVFDGSAHFTGSGADVTINAGQVAVLSGANPASVSIEEARPDAFVTWWREREYDPRKLAATTYVSPNMTGYEELDSAGRWDRSADYGEVWYPTSVPASWAPYRDGHWTWVEPWGWNWVDDQPWGFAPFHYGRWAEINGRWGWVPGTFTPRPVYAPALVAFIGAVTIAAVEPRGPNVGWFPLAPNEPYWPGYTRNANYIRRVNVTNVTNINNITINNVTNAGPGGAPAASQRNAAPPPQFTNLAFANRRFATVVPQQTLAQAAPVSAAALTIPTAALQAAPVVARPNRLAGGEAPARGSPPAIRAAMPSDIGFNPAQAVAPPAIAGQVGPGQVGLRQVGPGQVGPGQVGQRPANPGVDAPGSAARGQAVPGRIDPEQAASLHGPAVAVPPQSVAGNPAGRLPGTVLNRPENQPSATLARPAQDGLPAALAPRRWWRVPQRPIMRRRESRGRICASIPDPRTKSETEPTRAYPVASGMVAALGRVRERKLQASRISRSSRTPGRWSRAAAPLAHTTMPPIDLPMPEHLAPCRPRPRRRRHPA